MAVSSIYVRIFVDEQATDGAHEDTRNQPVTDYTPTCSLSTKSATCSIITFALDLYHINFIKQCSIIINKLIKHSDYEKLRPQQPYTGII